MTEPTLVLDTKPDASNPAAPWGYEDDDITPKAPLGYKADGTPRISNRGRKTGPTGPRSPSTRTSSRKGKTKASDAQRKGMLMTLTDMWVTTPLAAGSQSDAIKNRLGEKHTKALAGDAAIVNHYREGIVDGLIILSQSKPGVLAWMDSMEEKAPWIMLVTVGMQMTKAIVENHLNPSEALAERGVTVAQENAQAWVEAAEREQAQAA